MSIATLTASWLYEYELMVKNAGGVVALFEHRVENSTIRQEERRWKWKEGSRDHMISQRGKVE